MGYLCLFSQSFSLSVFAVSVLDFTKRQRDTFCTRALCVHKKDHYFDLGVEAKPHKEDGEAKRVSFATLKTMARFLHIST